MGITWSMMSFFWVAVEMLVVVVVDISDGDDSSIGTVLVSFLSKSKYEKVFEFFCFVVVIELLIDEPSPL